MEFTLSDQGILFKDSSTIYCITINHFITCVKEWNLNWIPCPAIQCSARCQLIPSFNKPMSHSVFIVQWATVLHRHPSCRKSVRHTFIMLWRVNWWATLPVMQWANELEELSKPVLCVSDPTVSRSGDYISNIILQLAWDEEYPIQYAMLIRTNQYSSYPYMHESTDLASLSEELYPQCRIYKCV